MSVNVVQFTLLRGRDCTIFHPYGQTTAPGREMADISSGITLQLETGDYKIQDEKGNDHLVFRLNGGKPHDALPKQVCIPHDPYVGDVSVAASKIEGQIDLNVVIGEGVAIGEKGIEGEFKRGSFTLPTGMLTVLNSAGAPRYVFHVMKSEEELT